MAEQKETGPGRTGAVSTEDISKKSESTAHWLSVLIPDTNTGQGTANAGATSESGSSSNSGTPTTDGKD